MVPASGDETTPWTSCQFITDTLRQTTFALTHTDQPPAASGEQVLAVLEEAEVPWENPRRHKNTERKQPSWNQTMCRFAKS